MNDIPTFSILIPVYNGEKYIAECLNSILPQLGPGDEVLVHDDGSTDATRKILLDWPVKLNVSFEDNRGVSYARNIMAERAKGDFLIFLDADDLVAPEALSAIRKKLQASPVDGLLMPLLFFRDRLENRINIFYDNAGEVGRDPLGFFMHFTPPAASMAISRALFRKAGGFCVRMRHSEEFDLAVRLVGLNARWSFMPDVLRHIRVHSETQASHNRTMCRWRTVGVLHRLARGRYSVELNSNHRAQLFVEIRNNGRLLFRMGEDRFARLALEFSDKLSKEAVSQVDTAFDRFSILVGHYRAEKIRKVLNRILGKNQWGQKISP
jgi:glycosyltransferase involved in cell wall biosynthesis